MCAAAQTRAAREEALRTHFGIRLTCVDSLLSSVRALWRRAGLQHQQSTPATTSRNALGRAKDVEAACSLAFMVSA